MKIVLNIVKSPYPNLSFTVKRDSNGKLIEGYIIFKIDTVQGELSVTMDNIEFRDWLRREGGCIIKPSL